MDIRELETGDRVLLVRKEGNAGFIERKARVVTKNKKLIFLKLSSLKSEDGWVESFHFTEFENDNISLKEIKN